MSDNWETYLFEYNHDGSVWCFEIKASSAEDARERLDKLTRAHYLGTLQAKIPVELGLLVRLTCWIQNLFRAR